MSPGKLLLCVDGAKIFEGVSFSVSNFEQELGSKSISPIQGTLGDASRHKMSLGPSLLIAEASSILAARAIFIRGPSHQCAFVGSSPYDIAAMMRMIYYHHFETNQSIFGMLGIDLSSYSALKESCETICEFKFQTFENVLFFFEIYESPASSG